MTNANPDAFDPLKAKGVPAVDTERKYAFFRCGKKLGISFWALPKLCKLAVAKINSIQKGRSWEKVFEENKEKELEELKECCKVVVMVNADHQKSWNILKRCVESGAMKWEESMWISKLSLTKHPKSGSTWAHRKWMIGFLVSKGIEVEFAGELEFCLQASTIYPKNYFAWSHRVWVVNQIRKEGKRKLLERQLSVEMKKWIEKHPSDHCGFHHRQFILTQLLKDVDEQSYESVAQRIKDLRVHSSKEGNYSPITVQVEFHEIWKEEFESVHKLFKNYSQHESIWCHYRALLMLNLLMGDFAGIREKEMEFLRQKKKEANFSENQFALRTLFWINRISKKEEKEEKELISLLQQSSHSQFWNFI